MKIFIKCSGRKLYIGDWNFYYKIFSKQVRKSVHLMRVIDSWGIDSKFFHKTLLPTDALIKVYDAEENKTYRIKACKFKENGVFYHFKNASKDHRAQIFLPRKFWEIIDHNSPEEKEKALKKMMFG